MSDDKREPRLTLRANVTAYLAGMEAARNREGDDG